MLVAMNVGWKPTALASSLPDVPPSLLKVADHAVVCVGARITGPFSVVIGEGVVVHPGSRIAAVDRDITIGSGCIIEEKAMLLGISRGDGLSDGGTTGGSLVIGSNSLFRVGCIVQATSIGHGCVFGIKASIGPLSVVGNGCHIGPGVIVPGGASIDDNSSLVHPFTANRVVPLLAERQAAACLQHAAVLQQLLPRFHNVVKSASAATATAVATPK